MVERLADAVVVVSMEEFRLRGALSVLHGLLKVS